MAVSTEVSTVPNYTLRLKRQRVNSLWRDIDIHVESGSASKIRREDPYLGVFASEFAVNGSASKFVV